MYICAQQTRSNMGNSRSSEVIATDTMSEDKSESFNVVNIHAPTAGIGLSLVLGFTFVFQAYKAYTIESYVYPYVVFVEQPRLHQVC